MQLQSLQLRKTHMKASLGWAGELLESLPPGVDEAVAISKVVQLARSEEYKDFSHVIFDTAPTGHTLRLLTLPEFLDATIGKPPNFEKSYFLPQV